MKFATVVFAIFAAECAAFQTPKAPTSMGLRKSFALAMSADEFTVGILGDLHIDPRKMEDYETGRDQWMPIFNEAKEQHGNVALVSLGDLGEFCFCISQTLS